MGLLDLSQIEFSEQIQAEWADTEMYDQIKRRYPISQSECRIASQTVKFVTEYTVRE
jgi:hypothetical protein